MGLDPELLQSLTQIAERAYSGGVIDGAEQAKAEYIGKSARVLTGGIFAASLAAAAQMLQRYDPEASQFFAARAAEMHAWITPATIATTEPADGATGIVVNNGVSVKFAAPGLRASSVTDANAYLALASGGAHIDGQLVYDAASDTITFTPTADLDPSTKYAFTLGAGLVAAGGLSLGDDHTITFTTAGR